MEQVARTDQVARLIKLSAKAIELTEEGKRDGLAEALIQSVSQTLQAYKDNKQSCGYPHYDDPNRPCFGLRQVKHMCQIKEGIHLIEMYANRKETEFVVTRTPFLWDIHGWVFNAYEMRTPGKGSYTYHLSHYSVIPDLVFGGEWSEDRHLVFAESENFSCGHHNCHHK